MLIIIIVEKCQLRMQLGVKCAKSACIMHNIPTVHCTLVGWVSFFLLPLHYGKLGFLQEFLYIYVTTRACEFLFVSKGVVVYFPFRYENLLHFPTDLFYHEVKRGEERKVATKVSLLFRNGIKRKYPTSVGDLSDASEASLGFSEVKIVALVSVTSEPYIDGFTLRPWGGGTDTWMLSRGYLGNAGRVWRRKHNTLEEERGGEEIRRFLVTTSLRRRRDHFVHWLFLLAKKKKWNFPPSGSFSRVSAAFVFFKLLLG